MKQEKAKKDMLLMLFFMALSLALLLWVIPTQIKVTAMMESESFTPRSFPYLIAGGLLAVSALGFVQNLVRYHRLRGEEGAAERRVRTKEEWRRELFPCLIFLLIVLYGVMFRFFGIVIATLIVPPVILWCLRCRKRQMYLIFYLFTAAVYLLFTRILLVPIH